MNHQHHHPHTPWCIFSHPNCEEKILKLKLILKLNWWICYMWQVCLYYLISISTSPEKNKAKVNKSLCLFLLKYNRLIKSVHVKKKPSIFYRMTNGLKLLRFKNPWRNANSTIQNNRNNLHTECIYRPQKVQQMI